VFVHILGGRLRATLGGKSKATGTYDIVHIARGASYRLQVESPFARNVFVCSTPYLENRIDNLTPEEAEQTRVNMKPN
jgi:quercetin dioxygenase-like cupin family protein